MRSSVLEPECGAGDDVLDGLGYEYLAAGSVGHHACGEMHGDATQGAGTLDNLAHVYTRARPDAELLGRRLNVLGGPNGIDRPFERGHEPVTGTVDQASAVRGDGSVGGVSVGREQVRPSFVSERARKLRRPLEVAEQDCPHDARFEHGRPDTGDEMFDLHDEAEEAGTYSRRETGLHHLAFLVASRAIVREADEWARAREAVILHEPREFPQYGEHCFATYWLDPLGFKLEAVCHTPEDT